MLCCEWEVCVAHFLLFNIPRTLQVLGISTVSIHVMAFPHIPHCEVTSEVLSSHEMDEMLSLVQRVPLVDFDPALKHMLNRKHQWYKSVVRWAAKMM